MGLTMVISIQYVNTVMWSFINNNGIEQFFRHVYISFISLTVGYLQLASNKAIWPIIIECAVTCGLNRTEFTGSFLIKSSEAFHTCTCGQLTFFGFLVRYVLTSPWPSRLLNYRGWQNALIRRKKEALLLHSPGTWFPYKVTGYENKTIMCGRILNSWPWLDTLYREPATY